MGFSKGKRKQSIWVQNKNWLPNAEVNEFYEQTFDLAFKAKRCDDIRMGLQYEIGNGKSSLDGSPGNHVRLALLALIIHKK